jgi:energy-coupling factor transporter ATPase
VAETMIKVENLSYRYPRTKKYVLEDISFEVKKGEFIAVMGENGAGKTTLCQCLNGVIPNSQGGKIKGRVVVGDLDTQESPIAKLAQKVGMVLQDPETQLFTTKVRNEVAFGPENLAIPVDEIIQRVAWALKVVRLEGFEERHPTALSGGQKQRLAVASVLAMGPEIMVLDEPTSQLDPIGTLEVFNVIHDLKHKYGMTIVMVTHKSEEIAEFADKVLVLHEGKMAKFAPPHEVFQDLDLMTQTMTHLPQISELLLYLKRHDITFDKFAIRKDEGVALIKEALKANKGRAAS